MAAALKQRGVLVHLPGPQTIRACTHLDVSPAQAERAAEIIRHAVPQMAPVSERGA
jgi:threonine aldolase